MLSSRAYGSPQHRKRIFVLAVRSGLPLPSFPHPTHANPQASVLEFKMGRTTTFLGATPDQVLGIGMRVAVMARDAIGDMPSKSEDDMSGAGCVLTARVRAGKNEQGMSSEMESNDWSYQVERV